MVTDCLAADLTVVNSMPLKAPPIADYDWTAFYVGGHLGYTWGNSNWAATGADGNASGSLNFSQGVDFFSEAGSWNEGVQFGYNAMLSNRFVLDAEADFTFPAYQNLVGLSASGTAMYAGGNNSYTDTLLASGTVRARIGYAPGNWLFYATGGLAWTVDQITLAQQSSGLSPSAELPRMGLGRGGWRRISDIGPMDGQGRISVHAIRQRHCEFFGLGGSDASPHISTRQYTRLVHR